MSCNVILLVNLTQLFEQLEARHVSAYLCHFIFVLRGELRALCLMRGGLQGANEL